MATITTEYAASANLDVTNLASIATSATWVTGWESDLIDNTTTKYDDFLITAKIQVAAAGLAAAEIRIYVAAMLDDSTWPGGFDGVDSVETTPLDDANGTQCGAALAAVAVTDTTASQVYYFRPFSVKSLFGSLPPKFVIFITHSTGANLAASGHQVTYKPIYYAVA